MITGEDDPSRGYLGLYYNHAISDGMGGAIVLNDILKSYNKLCQGIKLDLVPLAIIPTLEDLNGTPILPDKNVDGLIKKINLQNEMYVPTIKVISGQSSKPSTDGAVFRIGECQALKKRAKAEESTVGMALLAAVHLVIDEFSTVKKNPVINIDVDLRKRFEKEETLKMTYEDMVALIIGMSSVYDVCKLEEGEDFWSYTRRLKLDLLRGIKEKEHFAFHHAIEKRWLADLPDEKDLNFSNMGHYKYATEFPESGVRLTEYYTPGNGWCPVMFGKMVFLVNSVNESLCYTMIFEEGEDNRKLAENMLDSIIRRLKMESS